MSDYKKGVLDPSTNCRRQSRFNITCKLKTKLKERDVGPEQRKHNPQSNLTKTKATHTVNYTSTGLQEISETHQGDDRGRDRNKDSRRERQGKKTYKIYQEIH